ncbi:MAG TPA: hypothetical protein PKE16_08470 [Hyphomicrobium sp.]|nr:hypothetical protein [Hyphomicrobium sp.]
MSARFRVVERMSQSESAPAKINLTLEVLGRRADGYHELRSLVAFATDACDRLTLEAGVGPTEKAAATGPFGPGLSGANLVDEAVAAIARLLPNFDVGQLTLEKNLPVASGIGGGSADAAAAFVERELSPTGFARPRGNRADAWSRRSCLSEKSKRDDDGHR